ncbi:hypothetical protein [Chryseobacterium sp.]|uniref:hypothetical protein n=1 Tax=Chryseobacterium sp. TaxID=1871047 RepID=UPI0024E2269B|nr:hypothetical protein [Chryseobacterium sp.]
MGSTFDFSAEERTMILAALKHEKEKLIEINIDPKGSYDQEISEVIKIENEIKKETDLLSRDQLDGIIIHLGELVETNQFDTSDIYALDAKISEITDIP